MLLAERDMQALLDMVGKSFTLDSGEYSGNVAGTRDNFRHYALAAGDINPLWHDEDYARSSPRGALAAMPTWLYSVVGGYWTKKLRPPKDDSRSISSLAAGQEWEFVSDVHEGDEIRVEGELLDLTEKESGTLGQALMLTGLLTYFTSAGRLLARQTSRGMWYDLGNTSIGQTQTRQPYVPTPEGEVRTSYDFYTSVERRGNRPLYWDDVEVGSAVTPQYRPTETAMDIVEFLIGTHAIDTVATRLRAPADDIQARWRRSHFDDSIARSLGFPAAYNIGFQRISWLDSMISDWMGDHGILRKLAGNHRRLLFVGDTPTCDGLVTQKHVGEGRHLVDLDVRVRNQRDEVVTTGSAVVQLPARGDSP
jgi:acyl dehydratase